MVAIKTGDADAFIARPDPAKPVVLIYGPDTGLVHERAEALIKNAVDDPSDPFMLARIEADELSANPTRLAEEAQTIPMFGGRRAVWVRAGGRFNIVPSVEALLALPQCDCLIVIEAGELRRGAALRNLCERAKQAAAIACYADDEKSLPRLIDQEVKAAGLGIAPDARAMLVPLLGGDRQASRSELRKLILYATGKERIDVDDVAAVVANASALAIDSVIDAAFAGRLPDVETELAKLSAAATSPGAVIGAAQRQVSELHKLRLAVDDGTGITSAIERKQPPIHFRRKPLIETALKAWSADRLLRTMGDLAAAAFEIRRQAALAESIAQRALLSIAMTARRGR
jgi:DNA polymerase III subunit delta